ncbi:MAG: 4-(cytidine 5'-diphospho)-2-C-methyl-D-erythritol kinase [Deltaproteobacteria bacterium]|nr:4-(cytidine 5'-diphospho)-2-C-methyl-D-erythritol kinase [Deltaproteobacteria bacterium]
MSPPPAAEMSAEIAAPAKVNLGLRIVGVRADGYHELESLFVPLDLADGLRLRVEEAAETTVEIVVEVAPGVPGEVPSDGRNLAVRAAGAFLARAGLTARVGLQLRKRIPSPGGLGGGSSDAAAVLRGLAAHFPGALAPDELARLGLELGADVPFFLGPDASGPEPARVGGVGEDVAPEAGVPALALALIHPGPSLETARVYAEFDALAAGPASLTGPGGAPTMPALQAPAPPDPDRWRSAEWLTHLLANDLEPAARRLCPEIGRAHDALAATGALAVGLTGSGPTLFGIFPDAPAASKALKGSALRNHVAAVGGWTGVAKTVASRERS